MERVFCPQGPAQAFVPKQKLWPHRAECRPEGRGDTQVSGTDRWQRTPQSGEGAQRGDPGRRSGGSGLMVTLRDIVHSSEPARTRAPPSVEGTARCPQTQALQRGACPRTPTIYKTARPTGPRQGCEPTVQQPPGSRPGMRVQAPTAGRAGCPARRPSAGRGLQTTAAQDALDSSKGQRARGRQRLAAPLARTAPSGVVPPRPWPSSGQAGRGARARGPGAGPGPPCAGDRCGRAGAGGSPTRTSNEHCTSPQGGWRKLHLCPGPRGGAGRRGSPGPPGVRAAGHAPLAGLRTGPGADLSG